MSAPLVCDHCRTQRALYQCERCATPYCGESCQRVAWDIAHRSVCVEWPIDNPKRRFFVDAATVQSDRVLPPQLQPPTKMAPNQDVFIVQERDGILFIGVFDGHGPHGLVAAQAARMKYLEAFRSATYVTDWTAFLSSTTATVQAQLLAMPKLRCHESGTTATLVVIAGHRMHSGSVGDSGVLLLKSDGTVIFESPRPRSETIIKYDVPGQENGVSTYLTDSLGHVKGSELFRLRGAAYFQGVFVPNTPRTVTSDMRLVVASDGFFDAWDELDHEQKSAVFKKLLAGPDPSPARTFTEQTVYQWRDLQEAMTEEKKKYARRQRDDVTVVFARMRDTPEDDLVLD